MKEILDAYNWWLQESTAALSATSWHQQKSNLHILKFSDYIQVLWWKGEKKYMS